MVLASPAPGVVGAVLRSAGLLGCGLTCVVVLGGMGMARRNKERVSHHGTSTYKNFREDDYSKPL